MTHEPPSSEPAQDIELLRIRARAIVEGAAAAGAVVRLTGAVGVRERSVDDGGVDAGMRPYHDIDLVGRLADVRVVDATFTSLGYAPDRPINSQFGTVRRVYHHPDGYHVDLFLDRLDFCHRIELAGRLELDPLTLAPADLLLAKLQIVERNHKDLVDVALLLLNHELRAGDASAIETDRIVDLLADDWGLSTTAHDFLDGLVAVLASFGMREEAVARVAARATALRRDLDEAPKTLRWRTRARIGRRVRWYRVVEEVM
jgi:hypothetical protein